jgi:ABC-type polysaccharide transport system permease subunit
LRCAIIPGKECGTGVDNRRNTNYRILLRFSNPTREEDKIIWIVLMQIFPNFYRLIIFKGLRRMATFIAQPWIAMTGLYEKIMTFYTVHRDVI